MTSSLRYHYSIPLGIGLQERAMSSTTFVSQKPQILALHVVSFHARNPKRSAGENRKKLENHQNSVRKTGRGTRKTGRDIRKDQRGCNKQQTKLGKTTLIEAFLKEKATPRPGQNS